MPRRRTSVKESEEDTKARKVEHANYVKGAPFPDEIVVYILMFLSEHDLCKRTSLVSKKWYVLSSLDSLWEPLYWDAFGKEEEEDIEDDQEPVLWKNRYKLKTFEEKRKFEPRCPLEADTSDLKSAVETMNFLIPQERFAMAFDTYKLGVAANKSEKYEEGFKLMRKAIMILERTLEQISQTNEYSMAEAIKWRCLLAEACACKGFSLRRLGYLSVSLAEYQKSMTIVQHVAAENKIAEMTLFAKEIATTVSKNMGVMYCVLHKYQDSYQTYNIGIGLLEERVDRGYQTNKLILADVANLLSFLTNRIFVARHLKMWEEIAVDAINVTNTFVVYSREKEKRVAEKTPIPTEYEIIEEIFAEMIQFQFLLWPTEEQYKLLSALRKHGADHRLTQALASKLNPFAK